MPTIEELLRHELTRVADQVAAGDLRPLRAPKCRRGVMRRPLPVVAGLVAITMVAIVTLLAGTLTGQRPGVSAAGTRAPMPRFYVQTAPAGKTGEWRVVVHDAANGHVTGSVMIPGFARYGAQVSSALSDQTFVISAQVGDTVGVGAANFRFFLVRVSVTGRLGRPVPLQVFVPAIDVAGTALSPDGTMLAVSEMIQIRSSLPAHSAVAVVDLASGATRVWETHGDTEAWPGSITWTSDRTLAFTWSSSLAVTNFARDGIRVLDIDSKPADLLADSRFIPFPREFGSPVRSAVPTARGGVVIAAYCNNTSGTLTARIVELSESSGAMLRVLFTRLVRYTTVRNVVDAFGYCDVQSVDPSGQHVLIGDGARNLGRLDNGVYTALPPSGFASW